MRASRFCNRGFQGLKGWCSGLGSIEFRFQVAVLGVRFWESVHLFAAAEPCVALQPQRRPLIDKMPLQLADRAPADEPFATICDALHARWLAAFAGLKFSHYAWLAAVGTCQR